MKQITLLIVCLGYQSNICCALKCNNRLGGPVDWFIMYKLPKSTTGDSSSGTNFLYMDRNSPSFENSQLSISSEYNNPLYNTLRPLYMDDQSGIQSYAMYNDQPPMNTGSKSSRAHSKGAVAFGETEGFWIISSVPRFPWPASGSTGYNYGESQTKNGQIILCVTVPENMEDKINGNRDTKDPYVDDGEQIFKTTNPFIYDENNFTLERSRGNNPSYLYMDFRTSGDVQLKVFAKPKRCEDDIYSHFIAPMLHQRLLVQSWMAKLDDDDWVEGVKHVRFDNELAFHTNVDHSKWAVASTRGVPWTCIGDLNRDKTQFKRGGLSLCLNNERVAAAFRNLYRRGKRNPPPVTSQRNTCRNENRRNQRRNQRRRTRTECGMEQLQ